MCVCVVCVQSISVASVTRLCVIFVSTLFCLCVYLFLHCFCLCVYLFPHCSIRAYICFYIVLFVCIFISTLFCLCVYLFLHCSVCVYICFYIACSVCVYIYFYIVLFVCIFVSTLFCLCVYLFLQCSVCYYYSQYGPYVSDIGLTIICSIGKWNEFYSVNSTLIPLRQRLLSSSYDAVVSSNKDIISGKNYKIYVHANITRRFASVPVGLIFQLQP